jgi:hypothetical protein
VSRNHHQSQKPKKNVSSRTKRAQRLPCCRRLSRIRGPRHARFWRAGVARCLHRSGPRISPSAHHKRPKAPKTLKCGKLVKPRLQKPK